MKFTCEVSVLFQFHMFIPHVSAMLRDRSPHDPHMWAFVCHMSCGTHDIHMCLQDLACFSHVKTLSLIIIGKRVKLHTSGPHVDSVEYFRMGIFATLSHKQKKENQKHAEKSNIDN